MGSTKPSNPLLVQADESESILAAVERALQNQTTVLAELPALTNIAAGDPYLAQQLAELHRLVEIRPAQSRGWLARIRTRLAWWLLGHEIQQSTAFHASLVRVVDSLLVQLDQERIARRRIEEYLAYEESDR